MNSPSQIYQFYQYYDGKIWGVPIPLARQCIYKSAREKSDYNVNLVILLISLGTRNE